jgi:hypothetical protein
LQGSLRVEHWFEAGRDPLLWGGRSHFFLGQASAQLPLGPAETRSFWGGRTYLSLGRASAQMPLGPVKTHSFWGGRTHFSLGRASTQLPISFGSSQGRPGPLFSLGPATTWPHFGAGRYPSSFRSGHGLAPSSLGWVQKWITTMNMSTHLRT